MKAEIKTLRIMHLALLFGQVIFMAIAFFLIYSGKFRNTESGFDQILKILIPVLAVGGFAYSHFLFKTKLGKAKNATGLNGKIAEYRGALISRYAGLEAPTLFSIIVGMLTGNLLYLGIAGVLILYFFSLTPGPARIAADLELNPDEKLQLTSGENNHPL
jgi:hypothetical protein